MVLQAVYRRGQWGRTPPEAELWQDFFDAPQEWQVSTYQAKVLIAGMIVLISHCGHRWDHRNCKRSTKSPDFLHRTKFHGLFLQTRSGNKKDYIADLYTQLKCLDDCKEGSKRKVRCPGCTLTNHRR